MNKEKAETLMRVERERERERERVIQSPYF